MDNTKNIIEMLDDVHGRIGMDDNIDDIQTMLLIIKEYLLEVDTAIEDYELRISELHNKNIELVKANNNIYRNYGRQQDILQEANEEISKLDLISNALDL